MIHWSRSADSTVAERIRERSLLLVYSSRSSNISERSRIRSASWVCWTRPLCPCWKTLCDWSIFYSPYSLIHYSL